MIFVRDVRGQYQTTQVNKKRKWRQKNEKIIGNRIFSSGSGCIVFRLYWMAKFGCQSLVTHSCRIVSLFHARKLFEKRLQG